MAPLAVVRMGPISPLPRALTERTCAGAELPRLRLLRSGAAGSEHVAVHHTEHEKADQRHEHQQRRPGASVEQAGLVAYLGIDRVEAALNHPSPPDRKSTRLNSSHI